MDGGNARRDVPQLSQPATGKRQNENGEKREKYHPIACMSYQDALGTVDAHAVSEFTVIFLIESQRLITKNIHHRLGDHNEVLGDVLV